MQKGAIRPLIPDPKLHGPLDHDNGKIAIEGLTSVLSRSAEDVSTEALRSVAALSNVVQLYSWGGCESGSRDDPVDTSLVRQLARQELIRRGLEA